MIRIIVLILIFLLGVESEAIIIPEELSAGHLPNEFNIEIGQKDNLISFEIKLDWFWEITTDANNKVDSSFSVPYNFQTILEIKDNGQLVTRLPVGLKLFSKNPGYYFEVSKIYLESSKFTLIIHSTNNLVPYASQYWFNLKKMYDGLKAIEENKAVENGK